MSSVDLESVRAQVEILKYCKTRKAELKELEENARGAVEEAMGDAEHGLLDGAEAISWSSYKRRSLNQKALREERPEIVEEYTQTGVVRKFEIVDE
jgi:predicted phage-related endonuclease